MQGTLSQWLKGIGSARDQRKLFMLLSPLMDSLSSHSLMSANLVIKAGASAVVKTGSAVWAGIAQGVLVSKAGSTDMPDLSGTVTNAKFNVFAFFFDRDGTVTSQMGNEGATLASVVFPPIPQGRGVLGFVIINPTGTGNFVGGTTALDDATVVPNVVYVSTSAPFDPTALVS